MNFTAIASTCVALVLASAGVASCGSPEPSPAPSPTHSPSPQAKTAVDVYYVVDTRVGFRLAREQHDVPEGKAIEAAVAAMIAGADDPDYATTWNPETRIVSVRQRAGEVTVDLTADARRANVGSEGAALMIQQLVYTVTSAAPGADKVTLLIDGEPAGELWGVVSWDGPVGPDAPADVRQLVQIDTPREQAVVASPVVITGEAAVFEATLPWRVLDRSGRTVKSGTAQTAEGQRLAPFRFTVDLPPGACTIEVTEDDPSGGVAGPRATDTKAIVVRR